MDWIERLRQERIEKGALKYGSFTSKNFKDRNPVKEAIDEGIDMINYLDMASQKEQISKGLYVRLRFDISRILNILKINE